MVDLDLEAPVISGFLERNQESGASASRCKGRPYPTSGSKPAFELPCPPKCWPNNALPPLPSLPQTKQ